MGTRPRSVESVFTFRRRQLLAWINTPLLPRNKLTMHGCLEWLLGAVMVISVVHRSSHVEGKGVVPPTLDHGQLRFARQTSDTYYLDVWVLVDNAAFKSWYERTNITALNRTADALRDIKTYFTLVLAEVTDQYSRLQTSFRLVFQPLAFFIALSPTDSPWTEPQNPVTAQDGLVKLQTWLKGNISSVAPAGYDHAMLFTGKNLIGTDSTVHTTGRATVATMCSGDSVSIIEDRGAFDSVLTVVHELGHSMNATHDGESTANNCPASDRYIMTAKYDTRFNDTNKLHPWLFSNCTAKEIDAFVKKLLQLTDKTSANCLDNRWASGKDVPNVTDLIAGQMYDPDEQCKRIYSSQSSMCFSGNLSDICTSMACLNPSDILKRCELRTAATGTSCGSQQWCKFGQCVVSPRAPVMNTCYRDTTLVVNSMTCAEMAKTNPIFCYHDDVYRNCCKSCKSVDSGVNGCPYGDRKRGCGPSYCNQIIPSGTILDADCCQTCKFNNSRTCKDVPSVDGQTCSQAASRGYLQRCYETTFAFQCCATCKSLRDLTKGAEGCEYGNKFLQGCSSYQTSDGQCDKNGCCHSCSKNAGSTHTAFPRFAIILCMIYFLLGVCTL